MLLFHEFCLLLVTKICCSWTFRPLLNEAFESSTNEPTGIQILKAVIGTVNSFSIFLYAQWRMLKLLGWILGSLQGPAQLLPKRLLITSLAVLLILFVQIINWCFLFLDNLIFPNWRKTKIVKPWFVLGIPRSGTTFLHRSMAIDGQFTTTSLLELLFCPSISQKYLVNGAFRLMRPLLRAASSFQPEFLKKMESVHHLGLSEPEEDFLFLLNLNACFILIALFPRADEIWRLSEFSERFSTTEKKKIIGFYKMCVQKHLYFQEKLYPKANRTYLSKNPSFTPLLSSLYEAFPDGSFVACHRSPLKTVPSQVSSLKPAFDLVGHGLANAEFVSRCMAMLKSYYVILRQHQGLDRVTLVEMQDIKNDLLGLVEKLYLKNGLTLTDEVKTQLLQLDQNSKNYKSHHNYKADELGISTESIESFFEDAWPFPDQRTSAENIYDNRRNAAGI